jgi:DNA-binding response OmpR family regulator
MSYLENATRPSRVLVVEDQRHLARFLQYVLEGAGYEVCNAYDGEQALSEVDRFRPDAVVVDLVLPGISGLEVLRRLRAERKAKKLVILVLTPGHHRDIPPGLVEAGANAHCIKPVDPSCLLESLSHFQVPPAYARAESVKAMSAK